MSLSVFLAVLLAAFLHAAWNAMLALGKDRMSAMALISLGHWLPAALAMPFLGWVQPAPGHGSRSRRRSMWATACSW